MAGQALVSVDNSYVFIVFFTHQPLKPGLYAIASNSGFTSAPVPPLFLINLTISV